MTNFSTWYSKPTNYGGSNTRTVVLALAKAQCFYLGTTKLYSGSKLARIAKTNVDKQLRGLNFDLKIAVRVHKRVTGVSSYLVEILVDGKGCETLLVPRLIPGQTLVKAKEYDEADLGHMQ